MEPRDAWELRFDWILTALQWGTFTLGIGLSVLTYGPTPAVILAGAVTGAFVVAMQVVPRRVRDGEVGGELMALSGVIAALVAIALTDGTDSPYILFMTVPVYYASAFKGFRVGVETSLLASAGLAIVIGTLGQEILTPAFFQVTAFYVLVAVTFAQARRILIEERERAAELDASRAFQERRIERLEAAHNLLVSLSELADSSELNPVTVGEAALRDLALVVPFQAGEVALHHDGDVVVARRGDFAAAGEVERYPIRLGERELGHVNLCAQAGASIRDYRPLVEDALRPAALALDNIGILQGIASRAVAEERARVARELHDNIGPSLASLGLGLDVVLQQPGLDDSTRVQLEMLRPTVTRLVEDVRAIVGDYRAEAPVSIVEQVHMAMAEIGAEGPALILDIDERRRPRTELAREIGAIVTEAIRNAAEHAAASAVRVEGTVDRSSGSVRVVDDGVGFDVDGTRRGHFGITGMKERAADIGASLDIESRPGEGTTVTIRWGEG